MTKIKNTEFNIGDEVLIISSNTRGIIKDITSYLGKGNNIYLVTVNDKNKMCVESNLRLCRKNGVDFKVDINELSVNFQIEDRIRDIIDFLDLEESNDPSVQLLNASKLQVYLTVNDDYEKNGYKIGNNVIKNELYHGLVNGDYDSIINSFVFSEILKNVGMNVLNVAMKNEDGNFYVANLVLIENEYYYFDVTLEMAIFQENGSNVEDVVMCCGALGSENYEQFFKPLCILDFNNSLDSTELPKNISKEDIDIDLVNKLLKLGANGEK